MLTARFVIAAVFAVLLSARANAGQFGFYCRSDVSCVGLFNDLVTDRFTTKYPSTRWHIFVLSNVYTFGDGSGAAHATVGVTPNTTDKQVVLPTNTWRHILSRSTVRGAYEKQQLERDVIRSALEARVAKCDDSPECRLH